MRIGIAGLLILHGIAHLVGLIGSWQLAPGKVPYNTALMGGAVQASDGVMKLLGSLWLVAAVWFVGSAAGALAHASWWVASAIAVSAASLALCIVAWPDARIGVMLNLAILVVLVEGRRFGLI